MSIVACAVVSAAAGGGVLLVACSSSDTAVTSGDAGVTTADAAGPMVVVESDAAPPTTRPTGDQCAHAEPPAATASGATTGAPLFFALTAFDIGETVAAPGIIGFDLDGVCTGFPGATAFDGGSSCVPPAAESAGALVDADGGIDNVLQPLLASTQAALGGGQGTDLTGARIAGGIQTLLLRVLGYDGAPNATGLEVDVLTSGQLETTVDCDAGTFVLPDAAPVLLADGGSTGASPKNDGCDVWSVSDAAVGPVVGDGGIVARQANEHSTSAYMTNGTLVATFDHLSLPLGFATVDAVGIRFSGDIAAVSNGAGGTRYAITNGIVAGRVAATTLLASFKYASLTAGGPGICPGTAAYDDLLKPKICDAVDIASDPAAAFGAPCDGLSFAGAVAAVQTRAEGDIVAPLATGPLPSNCDAAVDTCN